MTELKKQSPAGEPSKFVGYVESLSEVKDGYKLGVRLSNTLERTIHYISDVRGLIFESQTRHLRIRLSDQGRESVIVGSVIEPKFRAIDPQSEAILNIELPKTIVKLSNTPSPSGDLLFEEFAISDAEEIEIEIGWSDTPYYKDPREKTRGLQCISEWEQQSLRITWKSPSKNK